MEWIALAVVVGIIAVTAGVWLAVWRSKTKAKEGPAPFRWQPEQDYDVVLEGEGAMTPPFTVLKKRKRAPKK